MPSKCRVGRARRTYRAQCARAGMASREPYPTFGAPGAEGELALALPSLRPLACDLLPGCGGGQADQRSTHPARGLCGRVDERHLEQLIGKDLGRLTGAEARRVRRGRQRDRKRGGSELEFTVEHGPGRSTHSEGCAGFAVRARRHTLWACRHPSRASRHPQRASSRPTPRAQCASGGMARPRPVSTWVHAPGTRRG